MDTGFLNENLKVYNQDIMTLGFSEGVGEWLYRHGYITVGQLAQITIQDLLQIDGIGEKDCSEIVEKMSAIGVVIADFRVENSEQSHKTSRKFRYPQNLIADIKNVDPSKIQEESYSFDQLRGIAVALNTLSDQEETMITLRYKHLATFKQIGNYYGITGERTRQIIKTALEKMRRQLSDRSKDKRSILIDKGLNEYIIRVADSQVEERFKYQLSAEYLRGYNAAIADIELALGKNLHEFKKEAMLHRPIEEFGFSVRINHILNRSGVNTLEDLLNADSETMALKLGKKSFGELAHKLKELGFFNEKWSYYL